MFLDEPTTGLDPRSRAEVWESIRSLAAEGTAIVLTTQYLEEADQLADEILVIDRGRTVASGTPESLKQTVGRDVLEISVSSDADLVAAPAVCSPLRAGSPSTAGSNGSTCRSPVGPVSRSTCCAGWRIRRSHISDFQLRRPTLDDAFLALTGAPATEREGSQTDDQRPPLHGIQAREP